MIFEGTISKNRHIDFLSIRYFGGSGHNEFELFIDKTRNLIEVFSKLLYIRWRVSTETDQSPFPDSCIGNES